MSTTNFAFHLQVDLLNQQLKNEQLRIDRYGEDYLIVSLIQNGTGAIISKFSGRESSIRDMCLLKTFLNMIEGTRELKPFYLIA